VETTTSADSERRHDAPPLTLLGSFGVAVVVPVGDDHETLDGTLVRMTGTTVAVDMHSGTAALTVSIAPRAVLLFGEQGQEKAALVRPGRRVDDVHSPTTIELVLDDVAPLAELERELAESNGVATVDLSDAPDLADGPVVAAAGPDAGGADDHS
jgi:hypothetical protein